MVQIVRNYWGLIFTWFRLNVNDNYRLYFKKTRHFLGINSTDRNGVEAINDGLNCLLATATDEFFGCRHATPEQEGSLQTWTSAEPIRANRKGVTQLNELIGG